MGNPEIYNYKKLHKPVAQYHTTEYDDSQTLQLHPYDITKVFKQNLPKKARELNVKTSHNTAVVVTTILTLDSKLQNYYLGQIRQ